MYEKFTDRARKVMSLANQEAKRFNHEYIGTEHVLLGLIKEGSGVAANVLKNLDVDLRKVRLEVEKLVQSGPDMVSFGKLPHTPRVTKVIEYSVDESNKLGHNYVGTEHILLGLLREQEGVAAQVLMNLGVKVEEVRAELLNLLGQEVKSQEAKASKSNADVSLPKIDMLANVPSIIRLDLPRDIGPMWGNNTNAEWSCEVNIQCPSGEPDAPKQERSPAYKQVMLKELKRLLIQQAETTTAMLKLLKDLT